MIRAASGAVRRWDPWNAFVESVTGLVRPIPPSLTGRPSRSRSCFKHGGLPVSAAGQCWNEGLMDFIFEWKQEVLDVWNSSQKVGPAA